ncbi:MAG: hypothetical protein DRP26_05640 [Candidatus Zixiibacteriota bacterium]|nr:MAG: hypothetical protein DRP26_05640 [candidate division Zixibacteria bacterium]
MGFIQDIKGCITAGGFYHDLLTRPIKQGWSYLLKLIIVASLIMAIFWVMKFINFYNDAVDFFAEKIKKVELVSGEITNIPLSHHRLLFKDRVIHVDRSYVDTQSIQEDLENDPEAELFVGPRKFFSVRNGEIMEFNYPSSYNISLDTDKLLRAKSYLFPITTLAFFMGIFVYRFIVALLYVILIITPIVLFKFRRTGLSFKRSFQVGLYLVSLQIMITTILVIINIHIPWSFLWFILFYFIYIGGFVNIDTSKSIETNQHKPLK